MKDRIIYFLQVAGIYLAFIVLVAIIIFQIRASCGVRFNL
jgi:hypothetical protein